MMVNLTTFFAFVYSRQRRLLLNGSSLLFKIDVLRGLLALFSASGRKESKQSTQYINFEK